MLFYGISRPFFNETFLWIKIVRNGSADVPRQRRGDRLGLASRRGPRPDRLYDNVIRMQSAGRSRYKTHPSQSLMLIQVDGKLFLTAINSIGEGWGEKGCPGKKGVPGARGEGYLTCCHLRGAATGSSQRDLQFFPGWRRCRSSGALVTFRCVSVCEQCFKLDKCSSIPFWGTCS